MQYDQRIITYRSETKQEAEHTRQFYLKHGAKVGAVFLDNQRQRIPNPKRMDGRYYAVNVRHPKKGYTFAAKGYNGMIRKPRAFIIGENGPERVNIRPLGKRKRSNSDPGLGNFNIKIPRLF